MCNKRSTQFQNAVRQTCVKYTANWQYGVFHFHSQVILFCTLSLHRCTQLWFIDYFYVTSVFTVHVQLYHSDSPFKWIQSRWSLHRFVFKMVFKFTERTSFLKEVAALSKWIKILWKMKSVRVWCVYVLSNYVAGDINVEFEFFAVNLNQCIACVSNNTEHWKLNFKIMKTLPLFGFVGNFKQIQEQTMKYKTAESLSPFNTSFKSYHVA